MIVLCLVTVCCHCSAWAKSLSSACSFLQPFWFSGKPANCCTLFILRRNHGCQTLSCGHVMQNMQNNKVNCMTFAWRGHQTCLNHVTPINMSQSCSQPRPARKCEVRRTSTITRSDPEQTSTSFNIALSMFDGSIMKSCLD